MEETLEKKVAEYIKSNPIKKGQSKESYYKTIAKEFEITYESARKRVRHFQKFGRAITFFSVSNKRVDNRPADQTEEESSRVQMDYSQDGLSISGKIEKPITSEEELLDFFEVDRDKWIVSEWRCGAFDVSMKIGKKGEEVSVKRTNYTISAKFIKKVPLVIEKSTPKRKISIEPSGDIQMFVAFGCTHRPFHNQVFWDGMMKCIEDYAPQITGIVNLGDFVDNRSLSTHEEWIPEGVDLGVEYSSGLQGVQDIQDVAPDARKIAIFGNHCDRSLRNKSDLRKFGDTLMSMEDAVGYTKYGWEVLKNWKQDYVDLGTARLFHGDMVGKSAAQSTLAAEPDMNSVFVHTHRFSIATNKRFGAYNIGWGGDKFSPAFDYMPRTQKNGWRNGFAVVYVLPSGQSLVVPIPADEAGAFFFQGKIYKGC